jgi:predicted N-acetyltransferase YhbS
LEAQIRRLNSDDDRGAFDCGVASLNEWLREKARQQQDKNLSRTFVATVSDDPRKIAGYYALAATSVETDGMLGKKLPLSVGAVLLGRLAVDNSHKGQGLGEHLLMHALDAVSGAAEAIGVQCVIVDAIDDGAAAFYQRYGFVPLTDRPRRLFLPVATIRQV